MITIVGTVLVVLATIGIGVLVDRKWSVIPRKDKLREGARRPQLHAHAPGEAPATALAVTPAEVEKLRREKCDACRGETDVLPDDRVTYDGRELLVLHARCRGCGKSRSTYVRA